MRIKYTIASGLAMFSMFFGSGNLVFPLAIGQASLDSWFYAFLGLLCTGVFIPFLGLFAIILYEGNYQGFFDQTGKWMGTIIAFFTLSLLGSFGVIPRCITVAHGGIQTIYPTLGLIPFSLLFCGLVVLCTLRKDTIMRILGMFLTPILLTGLAILIGYGIFSAPVVEPSQTPTLYNFKVGFTQGYQTMDLLAAFFFSAAIVQELRKQTSTAKLLSTSLLSSLIGASCLAIVYLGFVYLGAAYAPLTKGVSPELILPTIAHHIMGSHAAIVLAMVILLSCFTTAIALISIYAEYLSKFFYGHQKQYATMVCITSILAFVISTFEFRGVANFLAPILSIIYPALIGLTLTSILAWKLKQTRYKNYILPQIVFYSVLIACLLNR
ncbi:MAG: conserved rane protein of unknown function [Chlamydiales bacterium]|jgi:LIVCS family branched-chain amino acid:cation transporter|nr:conserved rane protein of unknown function [Chlamydiales bacterium]